MEVYGLILVPWLFFSGYQLGYEGKIKWVPPTRAEIHDLHSPWEYAGMSR